MNLLNRRLSRLRSYGYSLKKVNVDIFPSFILGKPPVVKILLNEALFNRTLTNAIYSHFCIIVTFLKVLCLIEV